MSNAATSRKTVAATATASTDPVATFAPFNADQVRDYATANPTATSREIVQSLGYADSTLYQVAGVLASIRKAQGNGTPKADTLTLTLTLEDARAMLPRLSGDWTLSRRGDVLTLTLSADATRALVMSKVGA